MDIKEKAKMMRDAQASQSQAAQPVQNFDQWYTGITIEGTMEHNMRRAWDAAHLAGQSQATKVQAEPEPDPQSYLSDKYEKKAVLKLSLRADSGYMSDETHRISADQWGRILIIANEKVPQDPTAQEVTQQAAKAETAEQADLTSLGWPDEIYLNAGDDPLSNFSEYADVSWCDHPQGESDVRYVRSDLAPTTSTATAWGSAQASQAAASDGLEEGLEMAARHLDKQRQAVDQDHAYQEPDTGAWVFDRPETEEYSNTLAELADEIRALKRTNPATPASKPNDQE